MSHRLPILFPTCCSHSLGGALATLFTADVGQYGFDAGRALPQQEPSDPWWKSIANTFSGTSQQEQPTSSKGPPRPKSLLLYNFGSPRVGNEAFRDLFDSLLQDGSIDQAYRIVNGEDVVTRLPRTMNALVLGNVRYDHVGTTVLVAPASSSEEESENGTENNNVNESILWVEGESDDSACPVRDISMTLSGPSW